jgi:hypothetical protein
MPALVEHIIPQTPLRIQSPPAMVHEKNQIQELKCQIELLQKELALLTTQVQSLRTSITCTTPSIDVIDIRSPAPQLFEPNDLLDSPDDASFAAPEISVAQAQCLLKRRRESTPITSSPPQQGQIHGSTQKKAAINISLLTPPSLTQLQPSNKSLGSGIHQ